MAVERWVHRNDIEQLAALIGGGITATQVQQFIAQQRANGNIETVSTYIDDHPGVSAAEIEVGTGIATATLANILKVLEATGVANRFTTAV